MTYPKTYPVTLTRRDLALRRATELLGEAVTKEMSAKSPKAAKSWRQLRGDLRKAKANLEYSDCQNTINFYIELVENLWNNFKENQ